MSRRPPVIGVSSYARAGEPPAFSLPVGYVDAVRGAGGVPVILPPGEARPAQLVDLVDGLVVAGGGDISPHTYGGELHESVYEVCEERDRFEFDLTRAALERADRPLLFICRGMQVLNVVCGGSLHVHIPDRYGEQVAHRLPPRRPARHAVRVDPDSRLAAILGVTVVQACSWHHQAIDRVGAGLKPVAWAEDGVVEAVERKGRPWCVAVQWHPEMQLGDPFQPRLFGALVAEAEG